MCSSRDHMRDVFVKTMGLSDVDIVALSGGHNLVCFDLKLGSYCVESDLTIANVRVLC